MTEHLIKPKGAHIRRIDIQYCKNGVNPLSGLRLCDKDNNTLLQCGEWEAPNKTYKNHTMVINEDERLVGVRSKTAKVSGCLGYHFDIEFLVCKYK